MPMQFYNKLSLVISISIIIVVVVMHVQNNVKRVIHSEYKREKSY